MVAGSPVVQQSHPAGPTSLPSTKSGSGPAPKSGVVTTFIGDPASTRWGTVQIRNTLQGGKVTASKAIQYPQNNGRDAEINGLALPVLNQEVVRQQSASIDTVSGATVTSDGYLQSLQSAIDQAHL
jgi:uncharacterized protein with FMN-binding domain